jgi:dihydrofolate synthase/folylpolyglutamate synthase
MTYKETMDFLFSQLPAYHRIGKAAYKDNLDNTIKFDEHLGHPHLKFRTIHVAGTNGKGSVSHMIASVLQEAGYRTGLYTSPHLVDFRERIKINGELIPEQKVISFVEENRKIIDSLKPSFFEMTVAMAFDYFAESEVEVAVIEVGLGGRLDSTNIITPLISVITNIGHDHMDLLGDTFAKVAAEKAGIIKPQVPVVISETQDETKSVFLSKGQEKGSAISFADEVFTCSLENDTELAGERKFILAGKEYEKRLQGFTPLGGDYQSKNIPAVFQVFAVLKDILSVSDNNITNGIRKVVVNTGLNGRWQILGRKPLVVCDTGHNKEGLQYVVNQLGKIKKSSLHMIVGFVNDKDLNLVLPLLPIDAKYYFTKASVPRALDENILKERGNNYKLNGDSYPDVSTAFNAAKESAAADDVIFIGGSTFIVADCLRYCS